MSNPVSRRSTRTPGPRGPGSLAGPAWIAAFALVLAAPLRADPVLDRDVAASAGGWLDGGGYQLGMTVGELAVGLAFVTSPGHALISGYWGPGTVPVLDAGGVRELPRAAVPAFDVRPNPFFGVALLRWEPGGPPTGAAATATIFDTRGRRVRTLPGEAGGGAGSRYTFAWDGRDEFGAAVGPGIYFCRLQAGPHSLTGRLARLR